MRRVILAATVLSSLLVFAFQNCSQSDISPTDASASSTIQTPDPAPAGNPTASNISDVRIAPGEDAVINILLNAAPSNDLVYTYSTMDGTAVAGTHYTGVVNGSGGIFAGSSSAQISISSTNTSGVAYFGNSFKVAITFPSNRALNKTVNVTFSAAPTGSGLVGSWALFPSSTFAPTARSYHSAVWTGSRVIIFGGFVNSSGTAVIQNNGKSYDPVSNSWVDINITGGPGARANASAVWTGSKMIVWGGRIDASPNAVNTGMAYDPVTNMWSAISSVNAPSARWAHRAVWVGNKMVVWGGTNGTTLLGDGAAYDPATDTWTALNAANAPTARSGYYAVSTGTKMIVWGGAGSGSTFLADGKIYDPAANTWTDINSAGAPSARTMGDAVWTGTKMIVWGGYSVSGGTTANYNTGGIYDPAANTWSALNSTGAPAARYAFTGVWTGSSAFYFGGYATATALGRNDGGIFY